MLYKHFHNKLGKFLCLIFRKTYVCLVFIFISLYSMDALAVYTDIKDLDLDLDLEFEYDTISPQQEVIKDPLEAFNRTVFATHKLLYNMGGREIIMLYQTIPPGIRNMGTNFANNLHEPINAVNHLLQLKIDSFFKSIFRFAMNSVFGVLGLVDIMSAVGNNINPNSFGATLHYYGIGDGFYLFLLGPSSLRDTVGSFIDNSYLMGYVPWNVQTTVNFFNVNVSAYKIIITANNILLYKANGSIFQSNFDEYATIRYLYITSRNAYLQSLRESN